MKIKTSEIDPTVYEQKRKDYAQYRLALQGYK